MPPRCVAHWPVRDGHAPTATALSYEDRLLLALALWSLGHTLRPARQATEACPASSMIAVPHARHLAVLGQFAPMGTLLGDWSFYPTVDVWPSAEPGGSAPSLSCIQPGV